MIVLAFRSLDLTTTMTSYGIESYHRVTAALALITHIDADLTSD
jgi:hypothetical protein